MQKTTTVQRILAGAAAGAMLMMMATVAAAGPTSDTMTIRGQAQTLHLYGQRGAHPVIVSSGDGGWMHLAPQVAETLAAKGFFVVGFDAKAYLASFTSRTVTLRVEDEPGDYQVLIDYASRGSAEKPILIGVSEGAGLSVLAASAPSTSRAIGGVVGLGLPDLNELGWRWRDSIIYLTHGVPNEPTFSAASIVDRISPVPIAVIQSARDEFVPLAEAQRVFDAAREPKRLWIVKASDHGFSDNRPEFEARLLEAIAWIRANVTR
jgi:fermentation-respiration switch protein FrsA (DUF1100 family)